MLILEQSVWKNKTTSLLVGELFFAFVQVKKGVIYNSESLSANFPSQKKKQQFQACFLRSFREAAAGLEVPPADRGQRTLWGGHVLLWITEGSLHSVWPHPRFEAVQGPVAGVCGGVRFTLHLMAWVYENQTEQLLLTWGGGWAQEVWSIWEVGLLPKKI